MKHHWVSLNLQAVLIAIVVFFIGFNRPTPAQQIQKTPSKRGETNAYRIGKIRAKSFLEEIKAGNPKTPLTLDQIAKGTMANNLPEALHRGILQPQSRCDIARSILSSNEFTRSHKQQCRRMFDDLATNAPCETIDGILAFYTQSSKESAKSSNNREKVSKKKKGGAQCENGTWRSGGKSGWWYCGCFGCACCIAIYN